MPGMSRVRMLANNLNFILISIPESVHWTEETRNFCRNSYETLRILRNKWHIKVFFVGSQLSRALESGLQCSRDRFVL